MTIPIRVEVEQHNFAPTKNFVLAQRFVGKFPIGETTPSVLNCENWITQNVAPVTITDFINGQDGQELVILGDGNTTIQDNARIVLGGDILLLANTVYTLYRFDGVWYNHV